MLAAFENMVKKRTRERGIKKAPPPEGEGLCTSVSAGISLELEADTQPHDEGVQDLVDRVVVRIGNEFGRSARVDVVGPFVHVIPSVDDRKVGHVEGVGHEVDLAGVAELDHLLDAHVQLIEGGERRVAEDIKIRRDRTAGRIGPCVIDDRHVVGDDVAGAGVEGEGDVETHGQLVEAFQLDHPGGVNVRVDLAQASPQGRSIELVLKGPQVVELV